MKKSSTLIAFISAFTLHAILGGLLLLGLDFTLPQEKPKVAIIEASLINQKVFDDLAARKKEQTKKEQRKKDQIKKEKARAEKEKIKKAKEAKAKIAKAKANKLAKEKAAKANAAKQKAEKVAKAKAAKQKAEKIAKAKAAKKKAEKIAKAKAAKKMADKIAKEKAAKVAKEKAEKIAKAKAAKEKAQKIAKAKERQRQLELDQQMDAEFADDFSSAQSAKQLSEIARYKALIQNKIGRNWQVDSNMKGKSCTLAIRLAPDGLVLAAERSKGDAKLCASAKRAAFKAKTLPIPKDPGISTQFRDFDITLEPDL